jgi:hypothetical protein
MTSFEIVPQAVMPAHMASSITTITGDRNVPTVRAAKAALSKGVDRRGS